MQVLCNIMTKILDTNNTIYIFFFIMLLLLWWGIRKVNIFVYLIFIKTRLFGDNCQRWQLKNETRRSTPSVLSWIPRQERCLRVCTRWAYYYRWIISILLYDFLRNPIHEIERKVSCTRRKSRVVIARADLYFINMV